MPVVGFNVAMSKDQHSWGSTIAFNIITNHYGNCWNSVSKKFTAPVRGLYAFHLTVSIYGSAATVHLMHGNRLLQKVYSLGSDVGTAAAVVQVSRGEQVYGLLKSGIIKSSNRYSSNFVGFLIRVL